MVNKRPRLGLNVKLALEDSGVGVSFRRKFTMKEQRNRAERTSFRPEPLNHKSKW